MSAKSISKKNAWLSVVNHFNSDAPTELLITGPIGSSWWDDSGTSEKDFLDALKDIPENKRLVVGINSEGGSVKDGLGIYNALLRRGENVTTRIDGYAVSIASVIALAGHKRISPESSIWMIHEPWSMAAGDAETMRREAAALDAHAETIAAVYADRTTLNKQQAREKMKAETWFRGPEAVDMGFATEKSSEPVALNAFDATKYRNVPKDLLKQTLAAAPKGAASTPTGASATPEADSDTRNEAPKDQPVTEAAALISTEEVGNNAANGTNNQNKGTSMENNAPAPAATTPPAAPAPAPVAQNSPDVTNLQTQVLALEQEVRALRNQPMNGVRVTGGGNSFVDGMRACAPGRERRAYIQKHGFENLVSAHQSVLPSDQRFSVTGIQNANTLSATLVPDVVSDGVIIALQDILVGFDVFTRGFTTDQVRPRANIDVPNTTAASTTLTNPTNFEQGNSTLGYKQVSVNQYAHPFHVSNVDIQQGFMLSQLVDLNAQTFANTLWDIPAALMTTANFTNSPVVADAEAFGGNEMKQLYASTNSPSPIALLKRSYYSKLLPTSLTDMGPVRGYAGFDTIRESTRFSAAGANVVGCAGDRQGILLASGLSKEMPQITGMMFENRTITVPQLGLTVRLCIWGSVGTRAVWCAWDVMFGAAVGDGTALTLLKSA